MEKRTHKRSPVRLDAIVHDKMYRSWDFAIEDFGFDGLRLRWQNKEPMPDSIGIDDRLNIKFSIAENGQIDKNDNVTDYHLEVKVVRILEHGLEVSLFNPALDAVASLSKTQLQEGMHNNAIFSHSLDKRSHNILEAVRQSFMKNLSHTMEIFLPSVHDALFQQAENSSNNTDQALYFDAINTLNKSKQNLKNQFLKLTMKHLTSCCQINNKDKESQVFDELELIDQNEFENWLTLNQLIVHISPNYEQELIEIELRLSKLFGIDVKDIQKNPFSPEIIFNSFSEAIHLYFLNNDILLILYHQFEKVIENHLFDVYKEINQIFIKQNIVPIIEKNKLSIVKESSTSNQSSTASEPSANKEPLASKEPLANINLSAKNSSQPDIPSQSQQHTLGHTVSSNAHLSEINTIQNNVNLVPTYQTLKELLSFQDGQELKKPDKDFFTSDEYKQQLNVLIDDLTQMQYKQAEDVKKNGIMPFDLVSHVESYINKDAFSIEIKNEFEYTLDIINRLFCSIQDDTWLGEPVKKLLSLLQIPLLKVSLLHKDFFESWSNPARTLINKLAIVDFDDEKNKYYLKAHTFILFILKNYDTDLNVFKKVQQSLTELLDIQSKHYKIKVNKVVNYWDAHQIVTNELATRLADKLTPIVIADFISYQWLPILVNTLLKQGKNSNLWHQYLQAMDMLFLSMEGDVSEEFIDKDAVLFIIKQGLEENAQYNKKIIDDIERFLAKGEPSHGIQLSYDSIIKLLINGYALSDKQAISKISQGATDAMALANKAIAKRLKINDYLLFKRKVKANSKVTRSTIRLQLIWSSDAKHVFVFVGRTGQQKAVFNLSEVVSMLDNGQLIQTKDYDLPLLERSLYAILGDVHDDIAKVNALDKLTGLIKQKEFCRLFNNKLSKKQENKFDYTLCLIDIDQFSLINDICGYDAGDKYISEIAQAINHNLKPEIICARYSTDSFILLLTGYSEQEASIFSESQRKLINNYNFKWDDKEFKMTASIGQISITENNEIGVYIKAVVTATTIAKETGRNRVHLIEYDALELNHRQELQVWATKVDQMVKNNKLDIRCQRIQPISSKVTLQHYEMLLLVKDENNSHMPPAEFIEAAELYNKMIDVDRWVISYVFDWFSKHLEQLETMGGIAINLSGQSLNNVDFYTFILDVFEQYPTIPHNKICFEITETMAITNLTHANNVIHSIKELGCEFSLDDFGTGQSSYAYLKNLPVDYLKIDGVFIKDIVSNSADRAMVKSINEIGHFLGMKTIAEYVENDDIVSVLNEIGVDYAQGFGIEKPILITEYMNHIEDRVTG